MCPCVQGETGDELENDWSLLAANGEDAILWIKHIWLPFLLKEGQQFLVSVQIVGAEEEEHSCGVMKNVSVLALSIFWCNY